MPIECNGVRADEGRTRSFTHTDGEDVYEIELTGCKEGGRFYKEQYFDTRERRPFGGRKAYIGGWGYSVDKDEEKVDSSTGLVVRGS